MGSHNLSLDFFTYRAPGKSVYFLLRGPRQRQAELLTKSRKKFLATTYKHFPGALYMYCTLEWMREKEYRQWHAMSMAIRWDNMLSFASFLQGWFLSKQGNQPTYPHRTPVQWGRGGRRMRSRSVGAPATFHSNTKLVVLLTTEDFSS